MVGTYFEALVVDRLGRWKTTAFIGSVLLHILYPFWYNMPAFVTAVITGVIFVLIFKYGNDITVLWDGDITGLYGDPLRRCLSRVFTRFDDEDPAQTHLPRSHHLLTKKDAAHMTCILLVSIVVICMNPIMHGMPCMVSQETGNSDNLYWLVPMEFVNIFSPFNNKFSLYHLAFYHPWLLDMNHRVASIGVNAPKCIYERTGRWDYRETSDVKKRCIAMNDPGTTNLDCHGMHIRCHMMCDLTTAVAVVLTLNALFGKTIIPDAPTGQVPLIISSMAVALLITKISFNLNMLLRWRSHVEIKTSWLTMDPARFGRELDTEGYLSAWTSLYLWTAVVWYFWEKAHISSEHLTKWRDIQMAAWLKEKKEVVDAVEVVDGFPPQQQQPHVYDLRPNGLDRSNVNAVQGFFRQR
ncbi:hypothetical protein T484DRAFT_1758236 [Baffinella frigidus]|nr:hypothetical protein T484DRAFT_1758236 [Cryptophyta sp. CCMP2293]